MNTIICRRNHPPSSPGALARRRWSFLWLCALVVLGASCSSADGAGPIRMRASIDGRSLAGATPRHPIALHPKAESMLRLDMRNTSRAPIEIKRVRIIGDVLSLD